MCRTLIKRRMMFDRLQFVVSFISLSLAYQVPVSVRNDKLKFIGHLKV